MEKIKSLVYIIKKIDMTFNSTLRYKSVQSLGYADDINILGRTN